MHMKGKADFSVQYNQGVATTGNERFGNPAMLNLSCCQMQIREK